MRPLHQTRSLGSVVVVLLAVAACAPARRNGLTALQDYPPELQGIVHITYYDVQGRTEREVAQDLRKQAVIAVNMPPDNMGLPVAETSSPMHVSWSSHGTGGASCAITQVHVTMDVQIQLPRWTPPSDADSTAVADWGRFIATMELHENGHKEIAIKAARDIVDEISSLAAPCGAINDDASRISRNLSTKAQNAQVQYDLDTHHGMLQGPGFPPSGLGDPFSAPTGASPAAARAVANCGAAGVDTSGWQHVTGSVFTIALPQSFHKDSSYSQPTDWMRWRDGAATVTTDYGVTPNPVAGLHFALGMHACLVPVGLRRAQLNIGRDVQGQWVVVGRWLDLGFRQDQSLTIIGIAQDSLTARKMLGSLWTIRFR